MGNLLEPLGIGPVAESVYRAMLAHPGEDRTRLTERLALSSDELGSAMAALGELALVRQGGTPGCAAPDLDPADPPAPTDPADQADAAGAPRALRAASAMEMLLARQEEELQALAHRVAVSRAAAARFLAEAAGPQSPGSDVGVEVLAGLDQIRDRLAALGGEVREELLTFAPDGAQTDANMRASRPLNSALLARGVTLRTVYLTSIRSSPPTLAHARWLAASGAQVRTVATLPTRMILVDGTTAVLPTDLETSAHGAVVVTGAAIVLALRALFEEVWAHGEPLGPEPGPGAARDRERERDAERQRLSAQEAATLRLMASGLTLGGIAKRLGVSPRTARRITAALMERLDAGSRFEAGVKAVQRGWLPVDS